MQIDSPVERAALAERAVRTRNIRRLWAFPGTRLGVVSHPARPPHRLFLAWRYWWQAHLFDCIVDAQLRELIFAMQFFITNRPKNHERN